MSINVLVYLIGIILVLLVVMYFNPLNFEETEQEPDCGKDKDCNPKDKDKDEETCEGDCDDIDCPTKYIEIRLTSSGGAQAVCARKARVAPSPISARFVRAVNHYVGEEDLSKDCYESYNENKSDNPTNPRSWDVDNFSDDFKRKYPRDGIFIASSLGEYLKSPNYLRMDENNDAFNPDISDFACGKTGDKDDCKDYFVPVLSDDGRTVINYVNSEGISAVQRIADIFYALTEEQIKTVYNLWASDGSDKDGPVEEIIKFDENSRMYYNQKFLNDYPDPPITVCNNYITLEDFSVAKILGTLAVQSRRFGINGDKNISKEQFVKMYANLFAIDYEHNAERGCKHHKITCMDGNTTVPPFETQMLEKMEECMSLLPPDPDIPEHLRPKRPGWLDDPALTEEYGYIQTPDMCMQALNPEEMKISVRAGRS